MSKILESIARENFRSSGYLSQPGRERPVRWTFTPPPRSPFDAPDTVQDAIQRRERALHRRGGKNNFLHNCLNVVFNR